MGERGEREGKELREFKGKESGSESDAEDTHHHQILRWCWQKLGSQV